MTMKTKSSVKKKKEVRQSGNQSVPFDTRRFEELLQQTDSYAISYADLAELFDIEKSFVEQRPPGMRRRDCEALQNRLRLALNSFCYALLLGSGWKDEIVDMDAAVQIADKIVSSTGFGPFLFSAEDILDLEAFASRLREPSPSDGVSQHLADQVSAATKELLRGYGGGPEALLQQALTADLNRIIRGQPLLRTLGGKGVTITWPPPGIPNQETLVPFGRMTIGQNRILLEATYPQEIARRHGTRILRPLTDEEVWQLGKRGVDSEADGMLDAVLSWIINDGNYEPKLTQRQKALLVDSVFQQAVVHPTHNTTQKALFLNWAKLPGLEDQARVAEAISRHASHCYGIKPNLAMTLEEREAEAQQIEKICRRAKKPNKLTDDECRFLYEHRPSSMAMARRMADAVPFATDRWFAVLKRVLALRRQAPEP